MRRPAAKPKPLPTSSPSEPAAPPRRQFSILGMFVVMLVCSMASAGAFYLVRADGDDPDFKLIALLFLLAGPMILLVIVSLLVALGSRFK
jgi:hypothetical protein